MKSKQGRCYLELFIVHPRNCKGTRPVCPPSFFLEENTRELDVKLLSQTCNFTKVPPLEMIAPLSLFDRGGILLGNAHQLIAPRIVRHSCAIKAHTP